MHVAPRPISQHKLQRIILWTLVLLTWFAAVLKTGCDDRRFRQRVRSLDALAARIRRMIFHRASQGLRRPRYYWADHYAAFHQRKNSFIRAFYGARLRKQLRHRDLATRIARMIQVLKNFDIEVARFAKRLKRNLTRYNAQSHALCDDAIAQQFAPEPCAADSS